MTKEKFIRNLHQALEHHDVDMPRKLLEQFADLNFEDGNDLADWEYDDFYYFGSEIAANYFYGMTDEQIFWQVAREFDLNVPEGYDED